MIPFRLCMLALAVLPLAAEIPEPIVVDAVPDRYQPAAYAHLRLTGLLADRMRVNLEGRLLQVDQNAMLDPFEHRTAPSNNDRAWAGEHIGKFLDAAANAYQYTQDHRLKELMDRMAKGLIATQEQDGYLGTYTKETRWTSWDVWVHKYDLLGLIAYYRVTGDPAAYNAANRIGGLLVNTFGDTPGKRDIVAAGQHVGMAATSVLEPMVISISIRATLAISTSASTLFVHGTSRTGPDRCQHRKHRKRIQNGQREGVRNAFQPYRAGGAVPSYRKSCVFGAGGSGMEGCSG